MPEGKKGTSKPEEKTPKKSDSQQLEIIADKSDEVKKTKMKEREQTHKTDVKPEPEARKLKKGEYIEGVGRRKRSTARVRIFSVPAAQSVKAKDFEINEKSGKIFFQDWQHTTALAPLERVGLENAIAMTVKVKGGGITGQAEAVRMGLSRALVELEPSYRGKLKRAGFLTRDPREKERKKYGLKKARRAPQFSKR